MRRFCSALFLALVVAPAPRLIAQEEAPTTRRIWDDAFRRARAEAREKKAQAGAAYLGLTVWRLRRASAEPQPEGAVRLALEGEDWWAESVEVGTRFAAGERLRLGIESARRGYLYVVDTEQNADGSQGTPRLVFPTTRTHGGDNRVSAGRLVEIPDLVDTPPYFSIQSSHQGHVADVLTIFVTPRPLEGMRPARDPLPITRDQLARWERAYRAPASHLSLSPGPARPYTRAEREAAASDTRLLAHDDPLPQALFRIDRPSGNGMWIQVSLDVLDKERLQ
jgi:hypothetical protein